MEIIKKNNNIILTNCNNFSLEQTFECGQCFRFEQTSEGLYSGVALGRKLIIGQEKDIVTLYDVSESEFEQRWRSYFDLDRDYACILDRLSFDGRMREAVRRACGLRILRQEGWETLCSFIISQNNNIPRIKKIISSLCRLLGEQISEDAYSFPTAEKVAAAGIDGLAPIRSGFRAKYIIDAARKVSEGQINLSEIGSLEYLRAREKLMCIKGVGEKVADCVLLFAFGFYEAFPKDVWVKRIIDKYYGEDFEADYFGENAGIAQQYLFYYERSLLKESVCEE
jgi:N-glycosylase/DNA lyase